MILKKSLILLLCLSMFCATGLPSQLNRGVFIMEKECETCKKTFTKSPKESYSQFNNRITCSLICSGKRNAKNGKIKGNWKGGRSVWGGYVYLYMPNYPNSNKKGYIAEHRFVMEKYLGIQIPYGMQIHHKNKNKQDNRIENLQLISISQHAKLHALENGLGKNTSLKNRIRNKKGQLL